MVKKGIPFRDSHEIIGNMVLHCLKRNIAINELSLEDFKSFSDLIVEDVYEEISLEKCVSGRDLPGGPAPSSVLVQIKHAELFLNEVQR